MLYSEAIPRAQEYARRKGLCIERQLGGGIQGVVFSTHEGTAIKALMRPECYVRERDAYLRLRQRGIGTIGGFNVPKLLDHHDELLIIEMQIVTPPYVLDFASAYVDEPPPYANDAEIMGDWELKKREQFEHHWPEVRQLIAKFQGLGIYLSDVKPGNIEFGG